VDAGCELRYFYPVMPDHLLLCLSWVFFCFFHSALASGRVKNRVAARWPRLHQNYRPLYTLFAVLTFLPIVLFQAGLRSPFLLGSGWRWIGIPLAFIGIVLMAVCIRKYFMRLSGLKTLLTSHTGPPELRIDGVHRFVRHPLYLGTFLFIWGFFLVVPQLSLLLSNLIIHGYTLIGLRFEEEKLVGTFGGQYERYREEVPGLVPRFLVKRGARN
jgi:protein-S-isoprenylcysteine O-methyltransferase Ste14